MHLSSPDGPSFSSAPDGAVTRATVGQDTEQPSLTSGFGSVMEQELEMQEATSHCLAEANGPHAGGIARVLRDQQARLAANVALLEQRYEMRPHPERFRTLRERLAEGRTSDGQRPSGARLPGLVTQHTSLLGQIDTLIAEGSDGQRGELILKEVARSHEEMAWVLTGLINKEDRARDGEASVVALAAEQRWENEGGGAAGATPLR
jgi:hypothetical protein